MNAIACIAASVALMCCANEKKTGATGLTRTCGWTDGLKLDGASIGDLGIGITVPELLQRCDVIRDTTEYLEGLPQRVMYVRMGSAVAYAEILQDSVWRIGTRDSLLRTAEDIGVGSSVADLRRVGVQWAGHGEGTFVGLRKHCHLSFEIGPVTGSDGRAVFIRDTADLKKVEDSRVSRVIVTQGLNCETR